MSKIKQNKKLKVFISLLLLFLAVTEVFAYDPPNGSETAILYSSPELLSGSNSVANSVSPSGDLINPAESALLQRITLDLNYSGIFGGSDGVGTFVNLAAAVPASYGVWSFWTGFVSSNKTEMPIGTIWSLRTGLSKELFPNLLVGTALKLSLGGNNGFGWGLGLDLGAQGKIGDLLFMKNFTWGAAIRNMGKSFNTESSVGISGQSPASPYDSPFTLQLGASADFLELAKYNFTLSGNLDFAFPTFQNLIILSGIKFDWKKFIWLSVAWDFNLHEALNNQIQSLLPSFGIGVNFVIDEDKNDSLLSMAGLNRSEIKPSFTYAPISGNMFALGTGVNIPIGVIDKKPPLISPIWPETKYEAYWFSPNSDGIFDSVIIPLTITDERYIKSFALKVMDEKNNVIKTIANKETRPENLNFKNIIDRILYVDKGVDIPSSLEWNGIMESGELAPDGKYSITIEAMDDNGNHSITEPFNIVIDTVAPELNLTKPSGANLIFSPDGDGNKDTFTFTESGSVEDLWVATISDSLANVVKTFRVENSALTDFVWDGKDDSGAIVADGIYSYTITSTDRAGNKTSGTIDNIFVNTEQPPISVSIDVANFSPNMDGSRDSILLKIDVPVKTGIKQWRLSVKDSNDVEKWFLEGTDASSLKDSFVFDGSTNVDDSMSVLPEGSYRTCLSVNYENGHKPIAYSPFFTLDVTKPSAQVSIDRVAFNPLGDADRVIKITQSGSSEEKWLGEIIDWQSNTIKTWDFINELDSEIIWDGSNETGKVVADGIYFYKLSTEDKAGNYNEAISPSITLNTENKAVRISVSGRAFSPNSDGELDKIELNTESQSGVSIKSWEVNILDSQKQIVKTFNGGSVLTEKISWNGISNNQELAKEGLYTAELEVIFITNEIEKASTVEFTLDITAPGITIDCEDTLFSPDNDGYKDRLTITQESVPGDNWEASCIVSDDGSIVRTWYWKDRVKTLHWDGTDNEGNPVPDGNYSYIVTSEDNAGNKTIETIKNIIIDRRATPVYITSSLQGFNPNAESEYKNISFGIVTKLNEGIKNWKLSLINPLGESVKTFSGNDTVPEKIEWNGYTDNESVIAKDDTYYASITVEYNKGNIAIAKTQNFVLDTSAPEVSIVINPEYFSPDNDGIDDELLIMLSVNDKSPIDSWNMDIVELSVVEGKAKQSERLFYNWNGKGMPGDRFVWDGHSNKSELVEAATDYPLRFTISDVLGNKTTVTSKIAVDVLVIRDGDKLKIKVPSIVFRSNFADFKTLSKETVARNDEVLKRIALILNRFSAYKIRVEGHANSIAKIYDLGMEAMEKEENTELLPLSQARAEAVMNKLIEYGVDAKRLTSLGLGSSQSVVDFKDSDNRWKNRRVEFILIKNR